MTRCRTCARPDVGEIDAVLASGASIRATAARFAVSRSALARHAHHADDLRPPGTVPAGRGRDQLEEATRQLERARTEREALRALEAVRAAYQLELRDWSRARVAIRSPDAERLAELDRNVEDAWAAYERSAHGSHDLATRALAGVREALAQRRAATARLQDDPLAVTLTSHEGEPIAAMELGATAFLDGYKVPSRYRDGPYRIVVGLEFTGTPNVRVFDGDEVVWERRAPDVDPSFLDAPSGNGNGHG